MVSGRGMWKQERGWKTEMVGERGERLGPALPVDWPRFTFAVVPARAQCFRLSGWSFITLYFPPTWRSAWHRGAQYIFVG